MKNADKLKDSKKNIKSVHFKYFCVIICAVLLLITCGFLLYKNMKPFYKVESRVQNLKKEKKKRSEEVVGWIKVQGTNIDYPIILSSENIDVNTILGYNFGWTNQKVNTLTNRPIIYGHNVLNLSSSPRVASKEHTGFEQLLSYIYTDFVEDNKYIQYTIGDKDYFYKIFAISFIPNDVDNYSDKNILDKKKLAKYIKESKKSSYFDFDVDVDANDGIITLDTCTRFFGMEEYSFRIDARLVRNGELMSNYSFKEKKSYNKIKKKLKGDETDEKA